MFPRDHHRIFKNPILELFTYMPWFMPAVIFGTLGIFMTKHQMLTYGTSWGMGALQVCVGFLVWTFLEYALHRFIFHMKPTNFIKRAIEYYAHGVHHKYPSEKYRLVAPLGLSLPIGFLFFGAVFLSVPESFAYIFMTGIIFGYLNYEWTHFSTHHRPARTRFGKYLKKYHMLHHHKYPGQMFGVSSPFWDKVFGTYQKI
jgi:dihydroceramide fatty acyl 2-hydroxylase